MLSYSGMLGWRYSHHGNMQIPRHSLGRAILELPSSGCHVIGGVMAFFVSTLSDAPNAADKAMCCSCRIMSPAVCLSHAAGPQSHCVFPQVLTGLIFKILHRTPSICLSAAVPWSAESTSQN